MASPIIAVLNCFAPASGANIGQAVLRSNGTIQIFGDDAIVRFAVGKLTNAKLPDPEQPPRPARDVPVRRGRPSPAPRLKSTQAADSLE